jgi:hypothetical protein
MRITHDLAWCSESPTYYVAAGFGPVNQYFVSLVIDQWKARAVHFPAYNGKWLEELGSFATRWEAAEACNKMHDDIVRKLIHPEAIKELWR